MPRKAKPAPSSPPLDRATFCAFVAERDGALYDRITAIVGATIEGANRAVLELTTTEVLKAFDPTPERWDLATGYGAPAPEVTPIAKRRGRPPKSATAISSPTTPPREPAPPATRRAPRVQGYAQATKPQRPPAARPRIEAADEIEELEPEPARRPRQPSGRAPALGMRTPDAIRASLIKSSPAPLELDPEPASSPATVEAAEASKQPGALPVPRSSFATNGRL